jgi:diadenosine tetraphosphate (Ap4A) HIT family hydrolase
VRTTGACLRGRTSRGLVLQSHRCGERPAYVSMSRMVEEPYGASEFTSELENRPEESLFGRVYQGDPPHRKVAETEHLVAFGDFAPLVAGHLLVVPRQNFPSFAALPEPAWRDWLSLRERLIAALREHWTRPVIYEHGSTSEMRGSACITHAHLQLVPAAIDLAAEMRADGLSVAEIPDQRTIARLGARERPYFYVERWDGEASFTWADNPAMPSQYLRRIAARALRLPDPGWDWGVRVRRELLRETVARLQGAN